MSEFWPVMSSSSPLAAAAPLAPPMISSFGPPAYLPSSSIPYSLPSPTYYSAAAAPATPVFGAYPSISTTPAAAAATLIAPTSTAAPLPASPTTAATVLPGSPALAASATAQPLTVYGGASTLYGGTLPATTYLGSASSAGYPLLQAPSVYAPSWGLSGYPAFWGGGGYYPGLAGAYPQPAIWDGVLEREDGQLVTGFANLPPITGRRRALVIGIDYDGPLRLDAGASDAQEMAYFLRDRGYAVKLLLNEKATRANIMTLLSQLTQGTQPGDALFFHFSGHGTQQIDTSGDEADGLDEALMPFDWETAGNIVDDDLYHYLVKTLPRGARLTAVLDCCHAGTALDLPYSARAKPLLLGAPSASGKSRGFIGSIGGHIVGSLVGQEIRQDFHLGRVGSTAVGVTCSMVGGRLGSQLEEKLKPHHQPAPRPPQPQQRPPQGKPPQGQPVYRDAGEAGAGRFSRVENERYRGAPHALGDVILFSGCLDEQKSQEWRRRRQQNLPAGAMTDAFLTVFEESLDLTYYQALTRIHELLASEGCSQLPMLSCSKPYDLNRLVTL